MPALAPIFANAQFDVPPPLIPYQPAQAQPGGFNALGPLPRPQEEMKRNATSNGTPLSIYVTNKYMRASPASPNDGPPYTPTPPGPRPPRALVVLSRAASPMDTDSDSDTGSERRVPRPPNPTPNPPPKPKMRAVNLPPLSPQDERDEFMLDGSTPTAPTPIPRQVSSGSSNDSLPSYASGATDKFATTLGEGLGNLSILLEDNLLRQEMILECCQKSVEVTEEAERERTTYWKTALEKASNEDPAKTRMAAGIESCAKEMRDSNEKVVALAQNLMEHSVRLQTISDRQDAVTVRNKFLASVMQFEEEAQRVMRPLRKELLDGRDAYSGNGSFEDHLTKVYVEIGTSYIANWNLAWPRFTHTKPELYRDDTLEALKDVRDAATLSVLEVIAVL
ncbi:hypothetical protein DL93DRAFT_2174419, partial [Clavulina sp. PMI_390]